MLASLRKMCRVMPLHIRHDVGVDTSIQETETYLQEDWSRVPPGRLEASDEMTADEAFKEGHAEKEESSGVSLMDPTSMKHPCTYSCLKGHKYYMLNGLHFAVAKATDLYNMHASQGGWTRCVHCVEEARITSAERGDRLSPEGCPFARWHDAFSFRSQQTILCAGTA